ncbi:C40 family peptidase [Stutzerimonas xanthomarina]|uniref:Cell wall-associated hydrolase, NlpC family n=2 Tax=Stutzerimonas xanthomarina TaxID=271420 RepID=A0A1M5RNY9_9GAMM|nr:C40 family peptidase [Stutzerimonas xanthomarina]MCP9339225.1 C40 family peptidase [Stutzerimonas xanthomarina]SEH95277.1 Cell wall-associated hydrolase, NlpC family [Stutzerimonas xanthomarina]SHH27840.1 Cell wall-associated hydrolase, NlpC family [Stutzerimonas xanthomarina DSM 18231]
MPLLARSTAVLLAAMLLAACSSQAPVEPVAVTPLPAPQEFPGAAEDVLFTALGLVGTPYRYGGNTPQGGFDCSGLITYVYRGAAGVALPRTTRAMNAMRGATISRDALKAGDLLFFATSGGRRVSHAAIYVGEGRFVHAPSTGGTVRLDSLSNSYWQKSYLSAKRVLDSDRLAQNP